MEMEIEMQEIDVIERKKGNKEKKREEDMRNRLINR